MYTKLFKIVIVLSFVLVLFGAINTLDNGLARTPPMGWLAWERFQCNVHCELDPYNCISEKLFMSMAERLIEDGYKDAGYEYINIDDCWMAPYRDSEGNMIPDPKRFKRGIKYLSEYMHARGLKLGIYQDFGLKTCMGFPGIIGHMKQDAEAFARWNVDMVKLDGCNSYPQDMDNGYIKMGGYLNKSGNAAIYSCSWPYYQLMNYMEPNYSSIAKHCNLWRNFHDIKDSWPSIAQIINFFGDNQEVLAPFTGPGHWNDPDMLLIGNFHLTEGQSRAQMAVWCILPAPLLMSNDLRRMKPVFRDILINKKAIAINQDPLGLPGKRIFKKDGLEIWKRPISPRHLEKTSFALLFLNQKDQRKEVKVILKNIGLMNENGYFISSIFSDDNYGVLRTNEALVVHVPIMDVVMLNCKLIE